MSEFFRFTCVALAAALFAEPDLLLRTNRPTTSTWRLAPSTAEKILHTALIIAATYF
jgi:hypothetical protein